MTFYTFLPKILNMSLTASVAIIFVLLLRLLLKKAPKVISYALWGVVLIRLLCPVSIKSGLSLYGLLDTPTVDMTAHSNTVEYIPSNIVHAEYPEVVLPVPGVGEAITETLPQGEEQLRADPLEAPMSIATYVWMCGILAMAIYGIATYLWLRRRLITASPLRDNIYLADEIQSPFVMGLIRPKIYLPSEMEEREHSYIILHEQYHIRRLDHIMKALAFVALCIHWFNPLVWVAFILSGKDMEMSCDEAVVRKLGTQIRADYTASLLSLATGKRIIAGMPLAFGEGNTKGRIKNLVNWKKPTFWVVLVAVVACGVLAICLLTNPYNSQAVSKELEENVCDKIDIQVVNMHNHAEPGTIEVTDPEIIEQLISRLQSTAYKTPLRKIHEAPDNLAADIALCSNGKSFMRILLLNSTNTGNEFEVYVYGDGDTHLVAKEPMEISGGIVTLIETNGITDVIPADPTETDNVVLIQDTSFTYDGVQYDLAERNEMINEITDYHQIGEYLVLEGHVGPKHNIYCVFNTSTHSFERDIAGANLTWRGNDINTAIYSYLSNVFTYDGRCLASYELTESEYIYSLDYTEDGPQIEALIISDNGNERTEIISPDTYIVTYSDLNRNRINEQIVVRTVAPGQVYELAVLENGEEIWQTTAGLPHVGWNTILIYSEGGQDYLVQYNPSMYQGIGSYTCTMFSLEGNTQKVKEEWSVDEFELEAGDPPTVTETSEMKRFAEEVNLILRNSAVLLSTEQGILVNRHTVASAVPQLYPVRFNPDEIQQAMEMAADPVAPQKLTANAAAFPTESLEFVFASGAGAWGTYLTLQPDGHFTGDYGDSDMATRYECKFEGQFTDIEQISDYSWAMKLGDVTTEKGNGTTWTEDGIQYIASDPHGISGGTDFILYAPGTPADLLPAACRDWWPDAWRWRNGEIDLLNGWALCNLDVGHGFFTSWLS